ncbi:hypothetical protein L1987_19142 [Smallanthus sonchifolius]|uniref:Uncharacterized protein n=1 Tax=Smallanthus sonchifolius TaxID=185202 RepID=A0ACB9J1N5_9ASTR|nr:hypothetical protein L1987_19142 [Smallanthus sonchifolius]
MQEELLKFKKLNVWHLLDLPEGKYPIGKKWVFRNKKDDRGIVVRNKACLVVHGFYQEDGLDYDDVFAPVARIEAIRIFLDYASYKKFTVYQMDVKTTFLYGEVKEEVYVNQPPGFEDPAHPFQVYKLDKALYGLHQAARAWYETLSIHLTSNGFVRGTIDKTLFLKKYDADLLIVQVYVDDIIYGSTNEALYKEFEQIMKLKFECKKQTNVSTSTAEAEYTAASSCCSQVIWIQHQMLDFVVNFLETPIYCDIEAVLGIEKNPIQHSKTKHIAIIIHTAISTQVRVFEKHVREFWENVEYKNVNKEIRIESSVGGNTLKVTEQVIREVLNFRDAADFPYKINHIAISGIILSMGYERTFLRRQVTKTMFAKQWKYLVHVLIHCMSPRTSAFDQIREALVCLATHRRFNFLRMIFEAMISNFVGPRQNYKFLMYPRFVQMIINTLLPNLENDGVELPLDSMKEAIFSSMNNMRKTRKFSDFTNEDEINDLMAEDIEDGVDSDNDKTDQVQNNDQGNDNDQGHGGENRVPEVNEEVTEPLLSHTEEFIAEADDVLSVNTEMLEINDQQLIATATTSSKKRKELEQTKTVPSRPPPSKGIVFTDPELQKKKKTTTRLDKGKGKAKEVQEKHKSKRSRHYELVDEEFPNYATTETADVVSQLKIQISNLQSREATNSREIRELKIETLTGVQIGTNLAKNVEKIHSPAATEPIPSMSEQVQTPVFEATMYEDVRPLSRVTSLVGFTHKHSHKY